MKICIVFNERQKHNDIHFYQKFLDFFVKLIEDMHSDIWILQWYLSFRVIFQFQVYISNSKWMKKVFKVAQKYELWFHSPQNNHWNVVHRFHTICYSHFLIVPKALLDQVEIFFFFLGKIYGRQKVSLKQVLKGDLHSSKFVKHQHGNFYVIWNMHSMNFLTLKSCT